MALAAAMALGGCATSQTGAALPNRPALQLPPASLGGSITAVQRLRMESQGQARNFDALLEADAHTLQLALLQLGQTIATLRWDGAELRTDIAPGWPSVIAAPQLLADLQYVWWPGHTLAAALPPHWHLAESPGLRSIYYENPSHPRPQRPSSMQASLQMQARAAEDGSTQVQLHNRAVGYSVTLHISGAIPPFAAQPAALTPPAPAVPATPGQHQPAQP